MQEYQETIWLTERAKQAAEGKGTELQGLPLLKKLLCTLQAVGLAKHKK